MSHVRKHIASIVTPKDTNNMFWSVKNHNEYNLVIRISPDLKLKTAEDAINSVLHTTQFSVFAYLSDEFPIDYNNSRINFSDDPNDCLEEFYNYITNSTNPAYLIIDESYTSDTLLFNDILRNDNARVMLILTEDKTRERELSPRIKEHFNIDVNSDENNLLITVYEKKKKARSRISTI